MAGERAGARQIRVVVGEDSPLMQTMIVEALHSDPEIRVVGKGADGRAVLRLVSELRPDCITLDLEMPNMDGLETLRYLMSEWPTPVVIVSAHTAESAEIALACLEYGAVDIVPKTWGGNRFTADELVEKVRAAATVDVRRQRFAPAEIAVGPKPRTAFAPELGAVVLIGASTGGPQALMDLVPRLPRGMPAAVVVVQHMPADFTRYFAERLDARSALDAREAEQGDIPEPGRVLVAPGGRHLMLGERDGRPAVMLLGKNERQRSACPSVDFAMTSFAPVFRERLVGVVLTGMGRDGAAGCAAIRANGGTVICQDRESSLVFGMPGAVMGGGAADFVVPLDGIAERIAKTVSNIVSRESAHERR
jgi:two-component system chemotaxis response regulator CheB